MLHWSLTLLILVGIVIAVLYWLRRTYAYWWRRRIKYIQPSFLFGNLKRLFNLNASFAVELSNIYFDKRFENEPAVGLYFFHKPCLLIRNLDLAKTVLIKDFSSFSNRYASCDPHNDKMGALNLLFVKNPAWREIRTKLAPVFTCSNIRQMFPLMEEIGTELEYQLAGLPYNVATNSVIADVTEICVNFTTDVIASIAFGLRANNWKDSHAEFRQNGRKMFAFSFARAFDFFILFFVPHLVQVFRATLFAREHSDFLRRTIHHVIEERERSGDVRHDLIDILLTLKKEAELNADVTHFAHNADYLVAQAAVFKIAGCETSSSTMAFALYELAKQPEVQARLRAEISNTFDKCPGGSITYEIINDMPYLDMVIDETLRLYPVVPFLDRECTPLNDKRRYSMKPFAEFNIPKGMPIFISNYAIHRDPKYWPEPVRFEPERFSAENKKSHTPMSYMPFGLGPHNCIGMRTGLLQSKLGLVHLLRSNRVEICTQTVPKIDFDPRYVLLTNRGGIKLKIIKCD